MIPDNYVIYSSVRAAEHMMAAVELAHGAVTFDCHYIDEETAEENLNAAATVHVWRPYA